MDGRVLKGFFAGCSVPNIAVPNLSIQKEEAERLAGKPGLYRAMNVAYWQCTICLAHSPFPDQQQGKQQQNRQTETLNWDLVEGKVVIRGLVVDRNRTVQFLWHPMGSHKTELRHQSETSPSPSLWLSSCVISLIPSLVMMQSATCVMCDTATGTPTGG